MALMTRAALLDVCKEHKLYRTPSLNDKLYLNFKGFVNIDNLDEYTALRALFLEGNALERIEGVAHLKELRCLYLQQNAIHEISGLDGLLNLDTLNISYNHIRRLDNLSCCPALRTLICTNNKLDSVESIEHLGQCKSLHTLDLQNNELKDPAVLDIIKQLPELRCLYLKGNPVVSAIKNYRKTLIAALPQLKYLDERPVFDDERRIVEAWARGGLEAEREERKTIKEEEDARNRANFEMMQQIRKEGWRKRRERLGLPPGDTDPALDEFSDEEYVFSQEPEELVAARARLAAYTARAGEEEPPELAAARNRLASTGQAIQQGVYSSSQAAGTDDSSTIDAMAYLDSVKQNMAELNIMNTKQQQQQSSTGAEVKTQSNEGMREKQQIADDVSMRDRGPAQELVQGDACAATSTTPATQPQARSALDTITRPAVEAVVPVDLAELD